MNAEQRVFARARSPLSRAPAPRRSAALVLVCATLVATTAAAASSVEEDTPEAPADAPLVQPPSADPVQFLPNAIAAAVGAQHATGFGFAGYDAATHDPLLGATVQARLGTRLVIGAGVTYAAATSLHPGAARPSFIARAQILDQQRHGFDMSVAFGFRQDRFVEEDGFMQGSLAGGWRSDCTTLLANLAYGRDGEGDDHEAEIRLAGFYRLYRDLHLGLDGHLQKLLNSTDPHLALHGTPSLDFNVGPVATLTLGSWALFAETGVSGVERGAMQIGAMTVGGLGAVF